MKCKWLLLGMFEIPEADSWGFGAKFASKHRLKCQQKNRMHPVLGSK